jgi:hypothetical protein
LTTKEISIFSNSSHFESSPLKPLNQIKANLAGMVLGWSPFNIMSDSPSLHSKWLLLLTIEISTIEEMSIFSNSSHLEWRAELSDTILKWDYPRTIPAKFGFIWFGCFRGEDLNVNFCQNIPNLHNKPNLAGIVLG